MVEEGSLVMDLRNVSWIFYLPASAMKALGRIRKFGRLCDVSKLRD